VQIKHDIKHSEACVFFINLSNKIYTMLTKKSTYFLNLKLIIFAFLISQSTQAQIIFPISSGLNSFGRDQYINTILDSVVNKVVYNKGGIICITDNAITIDTITLTKVRPLANDSVVLLKFLNKNKKKISSKEFWGITTGYGERRRFYIDQMYVVWESPAPYIYKIETAFRTFYYYSESLTSPINELNQQNVSVGTLTPYSKNVLSGFIEENNLGQSNADRTNQDIAVQVSVDVVNILFQVLLIGLESGVGSGSHPHSKSDTHVKPQTGRRR